MNAKQRVQRLRSIGRFGRLRPTRWAIALAAEARKSDPDLKSTRNPGDVGSTEATMKMERFAIVTLALLGALLATAAGTLAEDVSSTINGRGRVSIRPA